VIRVASGIVLVALLVAVIWGLPWWGTLTLAVIAAAIAGGEVAALAGHIGAPVPPLFTAFAASTMTAAFAIHEAGTRVPDTDALPATLVAIVLAAGLLALAAGPPAPLTITLAASMVLAPMYVGVPLGAAAWVRTVAGPEALTWLVAVIAISDSAQFYAGRAFGRRKLAPLVSPAKTVEGAFGGLIASAIAGAVAGAWWLPDIAPIVCGFLGAGLAAIGMMGDLFESLLKRAAGVKDSSHLIPGHGGMLDRIDSYLFAAPVYYIFLRYLW
jgi:phosphatidate cytidylyltransferase